MKYGKMCQLGYNVSYLNQASYYQSENNSGLVGYPDVIPLILENYETWIEDKYSASYAAVGVPTWIYVCLIIVGVVGNLINVAVFTRPAMAAPINVLLTALELVNVVVFLGFVPELIANTFYPDDRLNYNWNLALSIIRSLLNAAVFASNWISVTIGLFRFIAVTWPLSTIKLCSYGRAKLGVAIIAVTSIVVGSLYHCLNVIDPFEVAVYRDHDQEVPLFCKTLTISISVIPFENNQSRFNFESVLDILQTTVPVLCSIVFTLCLIINLCIARRRRRKLFEERCSKATMKRVSERSQEPA